MSFCNEAIGAIGGIICAFISWFIDLATSIGRAPPLEELPITSSTSQPTMALLEAFHTAEHNAQAYPGPCRRASAEQLTIELSVEGEAFYEQASRKKTTHNSRSKYHSLSFSTPFIYNTPIVLKPSTPLPLTSPRPPWIVASNTENVEGRGRPASLAIDTRIGDLGKRRGFKGAPLTFSSTSSLRSSFLSLPRSFSPWSANSPAFFDKPSSPRTPLEAVTKRMRSASTMLARIIVKDISQDLPRINDQADPFALSGDTYFAPDISPGDIPPTSLYSFRPYCRHFQSYRRTRSLGPGRSSQDPWPVVPLHKQTSMKTTIYDMSTSDVASARVSVVRNLNIPGRYVTPTPTSPKIVVTVPSAPSSPIRSLSSSSMNAPDLYEEIDLRPEAGSFSEVGTPPTEEGLCAIPDRQSQPSAAPALCNLGLAVNEVPLVHKRSACVDIRNAVSSTASAAVNAGLQSEFGSKNLSAPINIPPVDLYDSGFNDDPDAFTVPERSKRSSLRPLVLASRTVNAGSRKKVGLKHLSAPVHLPSVNIYDFSGLYDDPGASAFPDRPKSALRPLILPVRVASRAAMPTAHLTAPDKMIKSTIQGVELPLDRRSQELDDIIALLDFFVTQDCDM